MPNILLIQFNRSRVSNLHSRPRKNNHPFGIYENIKLGLIIYTLLGLIEHHGVFINSGHYVSYIRQNKKCYHCDEKHITETNLLTLSNNVYLVLCVCVSMFVCVFLHDNSKSNRPRNTKLEYCSTKL